jgi:hypothetical protein
MLLTKRKHPKTDEVTYQYVRWTPDGRSVSNVFVCADRIEVDDSDCHTSPTAGAAVEWFTPTYEATFRRGSGGFPAEALAWLRARFGEAVAAEVEEVLGDPDAFRA